MSNLLPCPACKCAKCMVTGSSSGFGLCGKCTDCAACGPMITQSASCSIEQAAIDAWNAMPRGLEWDTEPPKVAGWYWIKYANKNIRMGSVSEHMTVYSEDGNRLETGEYIAIAGPIPMPK